MRPHWLRLTRAGGLLSADVFEAGFHKAAARVARVTEVDAAAWTAEVLGPPGERSIDDQARGFEAATEEVDVLAPAFDAQLLAPVLLDLRARGRSRVRLFLFAHAPGASGIEWALLGRLLRPGDVVAAASDSASALLRAISSELAPYVHRVPHPVVPLPLPNAPDVTADDRVRLISLSRVHPDKLIHRQLDAMAVFRDRGGNHVQLSIAGAEDPADDPAAEPYTRALGARIERLGLSDRVTWVGEISNAHEKAHLLYDAAALLNLSVTPEESFGKSVAEAAALGVPAVVTAWDGLPETAGAGGVVVPVHQTRDGAWDVDPTDVVAAVQRALRLRLRVPAGSHDRYGPAAAATAWRELLAADRGDGAPAGLPDSSAPAAPDDGILASVGPLRTATFGALMGWARRDADRLRREWADGEARPVEPLDPRTTLAAAITRPVGALLAGEPITPTPPSDPPVPRDDWVQAIGAAVHDPGASRVSRLVCLQLLLGAGLVRTLEDGTAGLLGGNDAPVGVRHLRVDAALAGGRADEALGCWLEATSEVAPGPGGAFRLRQGRRVARQAGRPAAVLPALRTWLVRYPDEPGSGLVWLDLAVAAMESARTETDADTRAALAEEASGAIRRSGRLLGPLPIIRQVGARAAAMSGTAALAP